jgi:hypothetical protein
MKEYINSLKSNKKFNNIYQIFYLIILLGLIIYFWDRTLLYPFKLLVIFFHETSHALATILTGGEVKDFVVIQQQGGYVVSEGGNRFTILNSGYLGSLLWGLIIYIIAIKNKFNKKLMIALGIVIGLITLIFVRNLFAVLFGLIITAAMILIGIYVPDKINNFILRLIGLTSMIYVPLDIVSDTIYRSHLKSDASMLADEIGGYTIIWGGIWLIISLTVLFFCLRWTLIKGFSKTIKIAQK